MRIKIIDAEKKKKTYWYYKFCVKCQKGFTTRYIKQKRCNKC